MKNLFILVFLNCTIALHAQGLPLDSATKLVSYTAVVQADSSLSASELYNRGVYSFLLTFNNPGASIQWEQRENGTFIATGQIKVRIINKMGVSWDAGYMHFTAIMQFKKGKYRYEFTRFYHDGTIARQESGEALENEIPKHNVFPMTDQEWRNIKSQTDAQMKALIASFNTAMARPALKSKW